MSFSRIVPWTVGSALALAACSTSVPTYTQFHDLDKPADAGTAGAAAADASADAGTAGAAAGADGGSLPDADGGATVAGGSPGCTLIPDDPLGKWSPSHNLMVDTRLRTYNVKLPDGYDPSVPYRVIFLGPGCGGDYSSTFEIDTVDNGQAILIGLNFWPGFERQCFDDQGPDSFEFPYFDMMHKEVEAKYCVDTKREFYAGYSTGSWLANLLGCKFANVLRAQGGVSGQLPKLPTCTGPIAAMFIHDMMDTGNAYSSSVMAKNRVLQENGCNATDTEVYDVGPNAVLPAGSQCLKYTSCPAAYPVVFCTTMAQGHSSQPALAPGALWNFFSKL